MHRLSPLALLLLSACAGLGPDGTVVAGTCEGSPDGRTATSATGSVVIEARDGVLTLDYLDLEANCCPSPGVEVSAEEGEVVVDLLDVTRDEACMCMCLTDFAVEVDSLDAGAWHVQALFNGAWVGEGDVTL